LLPKFVLVVAAMDHELRKRGTSRSAKGRHAVEYRARPRHAFAFTLAVATVLSAGTAYTTSAAEGVTADAMGNIYGAEVGPKRLMRYVKN
jgi:hypothetical protein